MRVLIRNELDVDKPINLRRLSPAMKLYAGLVTKIHDTKLYKTQLHKRTEAAYVEQMKLDEKLKDTLLAISYRELTENKTLSEYGKECQEIILRIDSKYKQSLDRILNHKDFIIYNVERIQESSDVRKAFSDMPILLRVSKRTV